MMFIDFCRSLTDGSKVEKDIFNSEENNVTIPSQYEKAANVLIKNMKMKRDIFDRVNVSYVENAFTGDYASKLNDKLNDHDVPDELIVGLSFGIYGKNFNMLSDDERTIIKVLSVYICIQI